jgi:heparosan-N-sulfate-glucuronate 5-epimerase
MSHGKFTAVLQYFTANYQDYWHLLYDANFPVDADINYIYFFDISKKYTEYKGKKDPHGIYLFEGYDGEYHYHPLEIAQYSLAAWCHFSKTGYKNVALDAIKQCDWLIKNMSANGALLIQHKNPRYMDLPSPWYSGMAQGIAISSLLRAYFYTRDDLYFTTAVQLFNFLNLPFDEGGLKRPFDNKYIYEEYPRSNISGVLNGHISAALSVIELSRFDKKYCKLASCEIDNIYALMPYYDVGFYSLYSLDGEMASGFYHRYVTIQLDALSKIDSRFALFHAKFKKYQNSALYSGLALVFKIYGRLK